MGLTLAACSTRPSPAAPDAAGEPAFDAGPPRATRAHAMDDVIRVHHLQARGTHNAAKFSTQGI